MKLYNYKYELLADLNDLIPSIDKILGGISTLSFSINRKSYDYFSGELLDDPRYDLIINERLIEYDGEFYIIKDNIPQRDELGHIIKEITCKHISVELSSTKINGTWGYSPSVEYFEPPYNKPATLQTALQDLLKNHTNGWELGIVPELEKHRTFEFEWNTPMEIITDLSEVFDFIPNFRTEVKNGVIKKYVDILTDDYGEVKGYYRHDSTLNSIRKPINSDGITTRLYVFGYNDITINEISSETKQFNDVKYNIHTYGQSYVDNFDFFLSQGYTYEECLEHFVRIDNIKDDLYVDPYDLYDYAKEQIAKIGMPTVSYTVDINDVEFDGKPTLELGHKIRVYDSDLNIDLIGRVSKISYNHDAPEEKTIEIANYYAYLDEVDLLTNLILKQDKLQTSAVQRNSKFAGSVLMNSSTGIIVQAAEDVLSVKDDGIMTLSTETEQYTTFRDVVRIGQYEKGRYGIQVLDGKIQLDRNDKTTRILIDNEGGIAIWNNPDGDGTFLDKHRVFWVDVDGKLTAENIVVKNSYYYMKDGVEIEKVIENVENEIIKNTEAITSKVSYDIYSKDQSGIMEKIGEAESKIKQNADKIELTVSKSEVYVKDEIDDMLQEVDSRNSFRVEIISSNGSIFKNGNISTTLRAVLYNWDKDVTADYDAGRFRWTRVTADTESDELWNQSHFGGSKEITITSDDVKARATFYVDVLDEQGNSMINTK